MIKNDPRKNVAAGTMMDQLIKTILRSSHPNNGANGQNHWLYWLFNRDPGYNNPHITGHTSAQFRINLTSCPGLKLGVPRRIKLRTSPR